MNLKEALIVRLRNSEAHLAQIKRERAAHAAKQGEQANG